MQRSACLCPKVNPKTSEHRSRQSSANDFVDFLISMPLSAIIAIFMVLGRQKSMKIRRKTGRKRTYRKTPSLLRAFCVKYAKLTKKCFQSGPGTVGNELCFSLLFQLRCPESRPGRAKGAPRALQASPGSPKYTEMDQKGTPNRPKFRNGLVPLGLQSWG